MKFVSALAVGLILAGSVSAEEVFLDCRIVNQCLFNGDCIGTTERDVWILRYENGDISNVTAPFNCGLSTQLSITDSQVALECEEIFTSTVFSNKHYATINRISGEYFHSLSYGSGSDGILHFGQCSVADRQF
ncbi:hypothetical protein N9741_03780 [Octadecabacter sp.]|nr:hypothetical protein [Octadecabacter sp.]